MIDVLIVCSPGGHFTAAREVFSDFNVDYKYCMHDAKAYRIDGREVISVVRSERDLWIFIQILQALVILKREKPKVVYSSGASIAFSFFLVAKLLGIATIFVDTASKVRKPSLTAKLVAPICTKLYVRYPHLLKGLPGAVYVDENH